MKVSTLIQMLDEECQYYYSGPLQEEIYSVKLAGKGERALPHILYIDDNQKKIVMTQNTCLLSIPGNQAEEAALKLQKAVMRDYQCSVLLARLGTMAAESGTASILPS